VIGTHLEDAEAPRLLRGEFGWWFLGNATTTLLGPNAVGPDGTVGSDADAFLRRAGAFAPRVISAFTLTVLTDTACNLGCGYCFQNQALDAETLRPTARIPRRRLDAGTVGRIVTFARERMASSHLDNLDLVLFGGEPLLNAGACLDLLVGCGELGLRHAALITSGVLLSRRLAVDLYGAGLREVQVTFDGARADHDQIRTKLSGAGTFDTIVANIREASEAVEFAWHLRVNVSHRNADRMGELVEQLAATIDPVRCRISFAWIGDTGLGYGNTLAYSGELRDRFVSWSIGAIGAGFGVAVPGMYRACTTCAEPGGRFGGVVNADGVLYSCWQSAGKAGFEVGTVDAGYADDPGARWVPCGYEFRREDSAGERRFRDEIDVRILDFLHHAGRL
jgi:uncharacterized protein